ncbi:hypothetical protein EDB92DRAFT_2100040 [Lactarius akahatsu]|uniref:Uncharacterized protein n=1 Tax=Lactarius akahatsu TaxID=416441 RepID=A0AAD4LUL5_9AGAM|nr:hypothetical protein EDB92DRAFT_2100040 [Lactarius akahatsu]
MLTSSPSPAALAAPSPSSSARLSSLRRKKPSHHTRRPPPSRAISMFSSLKSLVTTPFSWFANAGNDTFEPEDTQGKRKLVHAPSHHYDSEGEQQDTPSAYRVKRIRLNSPERVATPPVPPPAPYLDPPTPSLRPSTRHRTHAAKSTRPYTSSNSISIPRPDTSRFSPLSNPPHIQALPIARTMSMDPPTAHRPSVPPSSILPPPISRDVSMEFSPNLSAEPPNPPFRMRSALTPQPGAPLYGPNPQRRERNPSEPPPLTALIENPIFVKPPPVPQEQRRVNDVSSSLTLGSLVGAQKSGPTANRSHSTLVLPTQPADGFRPTNPAELALRQLERYRTPLVPTRLGSANVDGALPELFQTRKKARALVLIKRDKRDDKPRLGHASKYISAPKDKEKETPSKSKNNKPYSGEGGLKKLLARRKQEELDAGPAEDDTDAQPMVDDSELEPVPPKRTSKITEPVRAPATFARKVSAPPTSVPSFGIAGGRKPTSLRASRTQANTRIVGPTRTRNRFSAAFEDDEPEDVDDLAGVSEEPPKDKEGVSVGLPKFEAPTGFSFAPPPSVTSVPQASDTPSVHDEPPITTLPFTFSKAQTPSAASLAPSAASLAPATVAPVPQPPAIALVPPTPDRPQTEKPLPEPALPNFFANSQIFARTGVPPPQTEPKPVSQPASEPVTQPATRTSQVNESRDSDSSSRNSNRPYPSCICPESQKSTQPTLQARAPSIFGPPAQAQSVSTASTQSINSSSLPFSLTPSLTSQPGEKKDASPVPQKPLFGGSMSSFSGFGTSSLAPVPNTKPEIQSTEATTHAFSFPKAKTPTPAEAEQPLKPALPVSSPALTSASLPATAPATETSKNALFSFSQSTKESAAPAPAPPATPAKSLFTFPSTRPAAPGEKSGAASGGFTFGSTTPAGAPSGFPFSSPAAQSETKPATSTSGFSFGTPGPAPSDTSKPAFSFGTPTSTRPLTPPSADDGMRMEESPTRGGGIDVNNGSAKPQSLPQLQMPGKSGFSFNSGTGAGFGSPLPSPFGGSPVAGFTFGQGNQATSQGTSGGGGFAFGANAKASESASGGFSFGTTKPAENTATTGFAFGQPASESRPSSSGGFAFNQPGPKTADATSSGFSFKAPESIQQSTSFTFGQAAPEPARTSSSSGFAFGQSQAQPPAPASPFTFGSSVSGGAFGSAPASPAFGTQPLAPTSSAPFSFGGPASAPPQQPASNPFGFGSGAGQPTSPAVQQGFGFNFGSGTPQTPTGTFGASTPQTPTTGDSGGTIFTMGAPPSSRPVRKLPRRPGAKR